jgi:hypothetical protein
MNKEMTKKGIALARLTHSNHVSGILVYGVNYIKRISPKVAPEYLEVSATHGVPIYLLHYNSKTSLFELDMTRAKASGKDKLINSVLAHQNLTPVIFTAMINRYCATENVEAIREYWWYNICKTGELKLSIVSGLTFEGNEESKIGRGHIYAISEFRHDNNRPRYDFVEIDIGSKTALAQVLTFFSLSDENASSYYAIVQYLVEEDGKNVTIPKLKHSSSRFFQRYCWELIPNKQNRVQYSTAIIEFSTIVGPAYVVQEFSSKSDCNQGTASTHDRFTYIPRRFTDRDGWESNIVADMEDHGLLLHGLEENRKYLLAQQTSHGGVAYMANKYDIEIGFNEVVYSSESEEED